MGMFSRMLDKGNSILDYFQSRKNLDFWDWVHELEEESLFLSSQVKQIAKEVFEEAQRQISQLTNRQSLPTCDEDKIFQKIVVLEENLQVIIQNFNTYDKAKTQFVSNYPNWEAARLNTIESLQVIGNSINDDRRKSNIKRIAGNCTSLVGDGLTLASHTVCPKKLSTLLATIGAIATSLGSATSVTASVTELEQLKTKVAEAKEIVKADELSFVHLLKDWLIAANSVSEAMNAILSIDVDNTIRNSLEKIKEFAQFAVKISNSENKNACIKKFVEFALKNLSPQFLQKNIFPRLLSLLMILGIHCNINQTVFTRACETWEIITNNILPIATISLEVLKPAVTSIFLTDSKNAQKDERSIANHKLIAGVNMSIDVGSIVLTTKDLNSGSISKEGLKIIEAATKMKDEVKVLESVYTILNS